MFTLLALVACTGGDQFTYSGYPMPDFFNFDGERTWTFTNADPTVANTVFATLNSEPEPLDSGPFVYTIDYTLGCGEDDTDTEACGAGDPFRISQIRWSADNSRGILIHSFNDAAGTTTEFDPPILMAEERGAVADVWTTTTTGGTYMSTFDQIGPCPVIMAVDWDECVLLRLDDDGDETTPPTQPLHGDWYAVAGFNVIGFQLTGDAQRWELSNTTFTN
jgi:hypothetical protein